VDVGRLRDELRARGAIVDLEALGLDRPKREE
jgi:hypothetical protein